jgi:hypothetical protein
MQELVGEKMKKLTLAIVLVASLACIETGVAQSTQSPVTSALNFT